MMVAKLSEKYVMIDYTSGQNLVRFQIFLKFGICLVDSNKACQISTKEHFWGLHPIALEKYSSTLKSVESIEMMCFMTEKICFSDIASKIEGYNNYISSDNFLCL